MRIINKLMMAACVATAFSAAVSAKEVVIGQRDKQFTITKAQIKVGDTVRFTNEDPFFHNIFSLSEEKTFDLGSFPQGQSRLVTFDKAGEIDVECAIHPRMQLKIKVTE